MTGARQRSGGLDQQGRFADPRIAADQQNRASHEAAADDTVQFSDPRGQARCVMSLAGERFERKEAASAAFTAGARGALRAFLAQRIPFPAGLAFALPAAERSPAVLADEGQIAFRHRESPGNSNAKG